MSLPAIRLRRWTRLEYDHMVEAGVFGPEDKVELLDGEIFEVSPQGVPHAGVLRLVEVALAKVTPAGFDVRGQLPIALDDASEPEPDVAVVRGGPREHMDRHPDEPVLVVEVSVTSLAHDRSRKLRAYARNGVPEYWIVNLQDLRLEVYREPSGEAYASTQVLTAADAVRPLYADAPLRVEDLLP